MDSIDARITSALPPPPPVQPFIQGSIVFEDVGTAAGTTFNFPALTYKSLDFQIYANVLGFGPDVSLVLGSMTANTYFNASHLYSAGDTVANAQAHWGAVLGDVGPISCFGSISLLAAPAPKLFQGLFTSNGAIWRKEGKCNDLLHDASSLTFGWTVAVAYHVVVRGYK